MVKAIKKGGKSEAKKNSATSMKFSLTEIDRIPLQSIFPSPMGCSLCLYKTKVRSNLVHHLALHAAGHSVPQEEVVNPVPLLENREKMFDEMVNRAGSLHKITNKAINKGGKSKAKKNFITSMKFSLTEIDKIPSQSIFLSPMGCSTCLYETKVRSNLVNHLALHAAGHSVPQEEVVNPVPLLENREKMFDEMVNRAGSLHTNTANTNTNQAINKGEKSMAKTNCTTSMKFSLTEIDKIPSQSIFLSPMGCSLCLYETKVRSNLVNHLALHAAGHSVPQEEVVNSIPWLEKRERMFDEMVNCAGSLHTNTANTNTNKAINKGGKSKAKKNSTTPMKFSLTEIDKIPSQSIFLSPMGCSLCLYETKVRSNLVHHLALHAAGHSVPQEEVVNPVPLLENREKMFDEMVNRAGSLHTNTANTNTNMAINKGGKSMAKTNCTTPMKFSLTEIDKIPSQSIFLSPMGCSLCLYETKVRSNLVHHLALHAAGHSVPQEEVVNPVPLLEKREKMFDEMVNCAGSLHTNTANTNTNKAINKGGKSMAKTNCTTPMKFSLTEIDKIPLQSIFPSPMGCSLCLYETKVRSNLVHHLALHAAGHSVPQEEVVNPVPLLENREKMFDEMVNRAGSLHTNTANTNTNMVIDPPATSSDNSNQPEMKSYWQRNSNAVKHVRGILIEEESMEVSSHNSSMSSANSSEIIEIESSPTKPSSEEKFGSYGESSHNSSVSSANSSEIIEIESSPTKPSFEEKFGSYGESSHNSSLSSANSTGIIEFESSPTNPSSEEINGSCGEPDPEYEYQCPLCYALFKYRCEFKDHLYKELSYAPWLCIICGRTSRYRSTISKHIKMAHEREKGEEIMIVHQPNQGIETWVKRKVEKSKENLFQTKIDKIPLQSIFPSPMDCSLCLYETKVRSNFAHHLALHDAGHSVPQEEVVNLVPLLEKREKMFDEMVNRAGSLHTNTANTNTNKVKRKVGKSKAKKNSTTPMKFSLTEIDKIPSQSIFPSPMGCSLCLYETKVRSNLVHHLALHAAGHSVPQEEVVNPVPLLEKREKMFDEMVNCAGSLHTNTANTNTNKVKRKVGKSKAKKNSTTPMKFSLTEIDKIPLQSIFPSPMGCSLCLYETKVRSNLVHHLALHAAGHSVPQEEVVNPVPLLEKREKMFDEMVNCAGSLHTNTANTNTNKVIDPPATSSENTNQPKMKSYWQRNSNTVKHIRGIPIEEESMEVSSHNPSLSSDNPSDIIIEFESSPTKHSLEEIIGCCLDPGPENVYQCPLCYLLFEYWCEFKDHLYEELSYAQ